MLKYVGIGLLFLLCVSIGFRMASQIEDRRNVLQAFRRDVECLLLWIRTRRAPVAALLRDLSPDGLGSLLTDDTTSAFRNLTETERTEILHFIEIVKSRGTEEIKTEGEALLKNLDTAEAEMEKIGTQTGMFRTVGTLCGAALAVLLW